MVSTVWLPSRPVSGVVSAPLRNGMPPPRAAAVPAERRPAACVMDVLAGRNMPSPPSMTASGTQTSGSGGTCPGARRQAANSPLAATVATVMATRRSRTAPVRTTSSRKATLAATMTSALVAKSRVYCCWVMPTCICSTIDELPM